ncbi:MAG: hypothetical protein WCH99_06525 [Verrucomicrobiota bacterium]
MDEYHPVEGQHRRLEGARRTFAASLAGGGPLGDMLAFPTDNGSGFITHAGYPIVPTAVDRWGNDWLALRQDEVNRQLNWFSDAVHPNPYLVQFGLFGLSAGENPEGWDADPGLIYQAYGIGGRYSGPNDGDHKVVTLHYSGMIASLNKTAALGMWNSLKNLGLVSPMNIVESMAVNPASGDIEMVNTLKGSWNLALFAEGWALAQPGIAEKVGTAARSIPALAAALNTVFPSAMTGHGWNIFDHLPVSTSGYVFTSAAGYLFAIDRTPNDPHLWMSDRIATNAVFTELPVNTNWLNSSWSWARQLTSITTLSSNGMDRVYVGSSGGIFEIAYTSGSTNVLVPFWSWTWDTTYALRAAGDGIVWSVGSYGAQSGSHYWTPASGFQFLHWADAAITNGNQLISKSAGTIFGWSDSRGFCWLGTNPPPILLQSASGYPIQSSVSADGGATWQRFLYSNGDPLEAYAPLEAYGSKPFLVVDRLGHLFIGSIGTPFEDTGLPVQNPNTTFFDENTGLLFAGNGSELYAMQLPAMSKGGILQPPRIDASGMRLRFNGRAGAIHRLESTTDLLHWTPITTNIMSPAGAWEFFDTQTGNCDCKFYRTVVLE